MAIIDTKQMQIKFPEEDLPLYVCDSSHVNNIGVSLSEDIIVPGKHEVMHRAAITNPTVNDSILEPNHDLSAKGVLVARVFLRPHQQSVPIQLMNPGDTPIMLFKGTSVGLLQDVEIGDQSLDNNAQNSKEHIQFALGHLDKGQKLHLQALLQ